MAFPSVAPSWPELPAVLQRGFRIQALLGYSVVGDLGLGRAGGDGQQSRERDQGTHDFHCKQSGSGDGEKAASA